MDADHRLVKNTAAIQAVGDYAVQLIFLSAESLPAISVSRVNY